MPSSIRPSSQFGAAPGPAPAPKKPDYREYVDPTGEFTSRELKYGLWYVKHADFFRRLLVVFLVGVTVGLWGYSVWQWGDYVIFGIVDDRALGQSLTAFPAYTSFNAHFQPQALSISEARVFVSGQDRFDIIAQAGNPNKNLVAEFDYSFVLDSGKTASQHTFLLPGERRPIGYLGLTSAAGSPAISVENIAWRRLSPHRFPDPAAFQRERLNFSVADFTFTPAGPDTAGASSIAFSVANNSAYGFVQPQFYVNLFDDTNFVGVLPWQPEQFISQEKQAVDLRSFIPNLRVTRVELSPVINVYSLAAYLPPPQ